MLPFELPPPAGTAVRPIWNGERFVVGGEAFSVLEYSENFAGWSDDLTRLHEDVAGDAHPIDLASRHNALSQLKFHLNSRQAPVIMEVGCSSGFLLRDIAKLYSQGTVIGADVVKEPLYELARKLPEVPLMRFDLTQCPLPSDAFDAIVMLNVLEHIEDDLAAVRQIHRLLKPGGVAVIEVPAGPQLYDAYDKELMHFRRYSMDELCRRLEQAGLQVTRKTHLGFLLYPAFSYVKRRNQHLSPAEAEGKSLVEKQAAATSASSLVGYLFDIESYFSKWFSYPTGIRCLVTCKKSN